MELTLHHYAFLTNDTANWLKESALLIGTPYKVQDTVIIHSQKVKVTFVEQKKGETLIELVEPFEDNVPLVRMINKGATIYHRGYYVAARNFDDTLKMFEEKGGRALPFFYSEAFNNGRCVFIMTLHVGLIEIIEYHEV